MDRVHTFLKYRFALVVAIAGLGSVVIALSYSSVRNHRNETPRESRAFTGRVVLLTIFWEFYLSLPLSTLRLVVPVWGCECHTLDSERDR